MAASESGYGASGSSESPEGEPGRQDPGSDEEHGAAGQPGQPSAARPWWGEPWEQSQPSWQESTAAQAPEPTYAPEAPRAGDTGVLPTGEPDLAGTGTDGPGRRRRTRRSRSTAGLLAGVAALALVFTAVGAAVGVRVGDDRHNSSALAQSAPLQTAPVVASNGTTSIEAVAASVQPSVVSISERTRQLAGTGSGFVVDSSKGYILTNNHVVSAAAGGNGTLTVTTNDGRKASATVVGRDPTADVAVIQVKLGGLTQARIGDSKSLKVGQTVVAFGSPLGLQGSVTSGIVSALDRPVSTQDANDTTGTGTDATIDAIQTDAAINPGNSGGPLVDANGDVVGVNSAIASVSGSSPGGQQQSGNIGVGFSIPIDEAKDVADQIIATGHAVHPIIGVGIATGSTDPTASDSQGATVARVQAGGPADKAGILQGDVITGVDGKQVTDPDATVVAIRANHKVGDKISLTYLRNGQEHTTTLTLAASPPSP